MRPAIAQPAQRDGEVEDHDRAGHAGPPDRHRIGALDRSDRQPDRRERPAQTVTGSDRTAGEQHRADRCEHEADATDAEQPGRRPVERCDAEQHAQCQPDDQDDSGVLRRGAPTPAPGRRSECCGRTPGATCRGPIHGDPVRWRSRAGRRPRSGTCRARCRHRGRVQGRHVSPADVAGRRAIATATTTPVTHADQFRGEQDDPQGVRTGFGQPSGEPRCPRDGAERNADSAEPSPGVGHARSRPSAPAGPAVDRTSCHRHVGRPP